MRSTQKSIVSANFSRAAERYHRSAGLHADIATEVAELCGAFDAQHILEVGPGTGFLTTALVERFPRADITAVELAPGMLKVLERNLPLPNLKPVLADIEAYVPDRTFDLIVSASSLQWIHSLPELFASFRSWLQPGGRIVFSLMLQKTFCELYALRQKLYPAQHVESFLCSEQDIEAAIAAAKLKMEHVSIDFHRAYYASAWQFFREIHNLGFGAPDAEPLRPKALSKLSEEYEKTNRDQNGVFATFHVGVYILAL